MRRSLSLAATGLIMGIPLFSVFAPVALADTITSGIYENTSFTMGNEWTAAGTYDDGIPEISQGNTAGIVTLDAYDDTKDIHSFTWTGSISTATVTVDFWNQPTDSSGAITGTATQVGSLTLSGTGGTVQVPVTGANGISFTIDATSGPGQIYISSMVGDPFDLTGTPSSVQGNVTTGEIDFQQPSWWNSGSSTGTSSPSSSVSTSGPTLVQVYYPPAPDWPSIEQGIANDIINSTPTVDAPPSTTGTITASATVTVSNPTPPAQVVAPSITGVPVEPTVAATSYDFSSQNDINSISIPTSSSKPFGISDPLSGLTYSVGTPVPGSAAAAGLAPVIPAGTTPLPAISAPTGGTTGAPTYEGSTALLGSVVTPNISQQNGAGPVPAPPASGAIVAPSPTLSSSGVPIPSISSGSSTGPSYNVSN